MTKKQVLILIGFTIILISIPLSLYLVRQTQIFAPKAAFVPKVEFVDNRGQVITETSNPNVKLKITKESVQPTESPSPTPSPPSPASIQLTTIDSDASFYGTYQSHNQKIVANEFGYFMTYVNHTVNKDQPDETDTWRLARSTDNGATFTTIYEATYGTRAPVIETDSSGNIYLVHPDWLSNDRKNYFYKFPAPNFKNPTIKNIPTLGSFLSAKYAMEIDEARSQLYFFTNNDTFSVIDLDGNVKSQFLLTQRGLLASMHYPSLYLDENGYLYVAWTTSADNNSYHAIHFIRSKNGGETWEKPNGQILTLPIIADESGPTDRISLDDEYNTNPWLSSFIIKGDKAHFMYYSRAPLNRQHYVRYNLTTGSKDSDIYPFKADNITFAGFDGFCATNRLSAATIYCINRNIGPYAIAVLKSDDNGLTWHDFALATTNTVEIYSLGGSPQITSDGYIIGSFTQSGNFSDPGVPKVVKFFKVPT